MDGAALSAAQGAKLDGLVGKDRRTRAVNVRETKHATIKSTLCAVIM